MSLELTTVLMLVSLIGVIMMGFPIGFSLAGVATLFGIIFVGPQIADVFMLRMHVALSDYILIAIPLFIFMGIIIEKAGIAGRLFDAMYTVMGGLRGGLRFDLRRRRPGHPYSAKHPDFGLRADSQRLGRRPLDRRVYPRPCPFRTLSRLRAAPILSETGIWRPRYAQ